MQKDVWEELGSWDYHFNLVRQDKELSDKEKALILEGWGKLRQVFGEGWLRKAFLDRHPLPFQFLNRALWQRLWLADLGERIYELKTIQNFKSLRQRLLSPESFSSAEAELMIASMLKRAGSPINLCIPKGREKKPDIITKVADEDVFIEVTRITSANEERQASETSQAFFSYVPNEEVNISGRLYKPLAPPRIRELQKKIEEAIEKVKVDKSCREINKEGIIDCFIAPKDDTEELRKWQQKKNISASWEGPPWNIDEVKRIKNRIAEKIHQIPEGKPGVIAIYDNCLIFQHHEPNFVTKMVYELEDTVYKYPNLLGVAIIITQWSPHDEETYDENEKNIFCKKTRNCVEQSTLILKNKYFSLKTIGNVDSLWKALFRS